MHSYQRERLRLAPVDETTQIVRALLRAAAVLTKMGHERGREPNPDAEFHLPAIALVEALELVGWTGALDRSAATRIGQTMVRLGSRSERASDHTRARGW